MAPYNACSSTAYRPHELIGSGALARPSGSAGWRAMLLSTVAVSALCVATPRSAEAGPDACTVGPLNVVTCSGNQSGGIDAGVDFNATPGTTLVINNLTQDIGPNASGGDGIRWALGVGGHGPITIVSNTGSFAIRATANGMNLADPGGDSITVNHTGNIFAGDGGISAHTFSEGGPTVVGTVSITMTGNIVGGGIGAISEMRTGNGDAGEVTVNSTGNMSGISARSLVSDGNGNSGPVTVQSNGNLDFSISAQSSVSGTGTSGAVNVSHQGSLNSGGINARSTVGGNGNSGSVIVSNTGNILGRINAESTVGGTGDANLVTVTHIGNTAGISASSTSSGAGNAGAVRVTSTGNVTHSSLNGIFARSSAGTDAGSITVTSSGNVNSGADGIFAQIFAGNNAGSITVTSSGNINSGSTGINAFSQGTNGNAGSNTVTNSGNINSVSDGIFAQTLTLSNAGTAGAVNVTSTGNIAAGTNGIRALSSTADGTGQGNILVTINDGTVRGGSGAGVSISGGASNALTVGTNAAVLSLSGNAIVGGTGNETVDNAGTVTGIVQLGAGTNAFNNFAGGVFNAGSLVDLGATGLLDNSGTLAPGGAGTAPITTALTGGFVQGAGGVFAVDVANGTADRLNVSGTANLSGLVRAMVTGLTSLTQQFTILSAAGNITNNGIAVQDTAIFDFELLFPNPTDMVLQVTANFTPAGAALTPNQRVTAAHLQSALGAGGGNLGGLFNFLGSFLDVTAFAKALDRLHPEPYLAPVQSALLANLGFTDSLMSCPTAASGDASVFIAEGQCAWARMGARQLNVDRTVENIGYKDKAWGGSAGVQFALAPNWFGSIALGYDRSDIKIDDRAAGAGDLLHLGAAAKYISGNWQVSAALAGGHASYDLTRFGVMPGVNATGDLSLNFLSGRLRTAYVFGSENAYVKPMLDIDAIGIWRGGIQETGAGPVGLNVRSQTDTLFSVAPAVEVGGQFAYANGLLRPFLRAGVRLFSEDDLKATASFIGSPTAVPGFTVTTPLDQWMGEVSTGLEMLGNDRYDARISYESRFGERTTQHGGSLKLRAKL